MDRLWGMEVFMRVMECGSFSRAAESLDLANATVTSSLRNLEKHLGVTLIQRNTR
ncbi:MAG: helix-turn-helix domain-containing protein, partial [Advenella sp.]